MNRLYLISSLLGAIGGVVLAAKNWGDLTSPAAVGGMLVSLSSVLLAAYKVELGK